MNCPECQTELIDNTCTIYCMKCGYYTGQTPVTWAQTQANFAAIGLNVQRFNPLLDCWEE
jgi:uncharacterized Zn finger protein (UPF0148 family)